MTTSSQTHRIRGRGRRAFWVIVVGGALISALWVARPDARAGRAAGRHNGRLAQQALTDLAADLRAGSMWVDLADITPLQADRLADLLESKQNVFADLDARREVLVQRIETALLGDALDPAELVTIQEEARTLAATSADELLIALVQLREQLTDAQRATLAEHWRQR